MTGALSIKFDPMKLEDDVRRFWRENDVKNKMRDLRRSSCIGKFGYVEGPPTLNGFQHVGHARGRVIKDLWYRFRTMQGYFVLFRGGWDCQGLPVEIQVEKELGVHEGKRELLKEVGEERFVEECKKLIMRYYGHWKEMDEKLAVFIDHEKAFWTYKDEYIEREWQYLRRAHEQGLLGKGYRVVAYCPHCQTSLSNTEVGLGYEEVEDPSLYFKVRRQGTENEYFVVWTTMPFTIVTDMMLAVRPEAEYSKVKVGSEIWIMASSRVESVLGMLGVEKYEISDKVQGRSLEGERYEFPFLDLVPKQQEYDKLANVHRVVAEDFVDVETATGVVHLSPGNGEDDFNTAQERGVPIFAPFDDEAKFTEDAGFFASMFARDADQAVISKLREKGLLLLCKTEKHEYPTCWRSHHKLIYLAKKEYFYWTDRIVDRIVKAAESVNYFYESPKNRFISILREKKPWCISRERVWGTPLPIWVCETCGSTEYLFSRGEIVARASNLPDGVDFELHKPWIDRVAIACLKCGGRMRREDFVLDCWHNSGVAAYAGFTDEEFREFVPVEFLTEAIDQTRGWANRLLIAHVLFTGEAESPFKSYLFYGHVLDEKGRKMSKSLGNVIETADVLSRYPADLYRLYMLWKCSPIDLMFFSFKEMNERPYQFLNTLYNLHRYLQENGTYDRFNPKSFTLDSAEAGSLLEPADRWILSRLQDLIQRVTEGYESAQYNFLLSLIEAFVIEDLSRNYVPMIRRELWSDAPETYGRRMAVYSVLWHALRSVMLLLNPMIPHFAEAMHQNVFLSFDDSLPLSINFEDWPRVEKRFRDTSLEESFNTLLEVVSLSNSARQAAKVKRRWPLSRMLVVVPKGRLQGITLLKDLLRELSNVQEVLISSDPRGTGVGLKVSLNLSSAGPKLRGLTGQVASVLKLLDGYDVRQRLEADQKLLLEIGQTKVELRSEDLVFTYEPPEGYSLVADGELLVGVDIRRDDVLIGKGLMRDIARRLQALRKELNLKPSDYLKCAYIFGLDDESQNLIRPYLAEMRDLVRSRGVVICRDKGDVDVQWNEFEMDDRKILLALSP
jgi:isoleucyl-tRNA synthetase